MHIRDSQQGESRYHYDPLDRLLEVRGDLSERFLHDPAGNLLSQTQGSTFTSARTQGNRLLFSGDRHFDYDEFGRLTTERRGKGQALVTRYEYDCQHRLIQAELSDGSTARYHYDAFGRRIRKTLARQGQDPLITEFLWQANNLIAESCSDGTYHSFIYEPGSFRPLVQLEGEGEAAEPYHYQLDQIGTPLALTSHSGQTAWRVRYRAYGNVWKQELAEVESPLRFQGQYHDAETGLHYNRHRYYQPDTGRFITPDPIGLAGGLNNYQYAPNPTGWVDPLGLSNVPGQCPPRSTVPSGVPISQRKFDEILKTPKGERPSPEVYLPSAYIDAHLAQFDNGASRVMKASDYHEYGLGKPDAMKSEFVSTKGDIDLIISQSNGNMNSIAKQLGIPPEQLQGDILLRIDFPNPKKLGLQIPSGNEWGANLQWIPGGKLPTGKSEAVISTEGLQRSDFIITNLKTGEVIK